jgi:hypothetical protein
MVIRRERARLPVRSAINKQCTSGLIVWWVTTGEPPLLYVLDILSAHPISLQDVFTARETPPQIRLDFCASAPPRRTSCHAHKLDQLANSRRLSFAG